MPCLSCLQFAEFEASRVKAQLLCTATTVRGLPVPISIAFILTIDASGPLRDEGLSVLAVYQIPREMTVPLDRAPVQVERS